VVLRVLGRRHTLRQRDHWTREQLQAHQARALQLLRGYADAHSPFYRRFHAGRTDHPLRELPVLTKAMAMEHFDQLGPTRRSRWPRSRPSWPPLRAASASMAATGWRSPRARPAGAGSSCGTWTSGSRAGLLQPVPGLGRRHRQPDSAVRMAVVSSTTPWHQSAKAAATTTKAAAIPASTAMTLGRPSGTAKPR
jgi:phenylacetate-CoA ligase